MPRYEDDNEPMACNIPVYLSAAHVLAIAALLRVADDDLMAELGIVPYLSNKIDGAFEALESVCDANFGTDWVALVATADQLDLEADEEDVD